MSINCYFVTAPSFSKFNFRVIRSNQNKMQPKMLKRSAYTSLFKINFSAQKAYGILMYHTFFCLMGFNVVTYQFNNLSIQILFFLVSKTIFDGQARNCYFWADFKDSIIPYIMFGPK